MRMYRKFGQALAILCCVVMFALAIGYLFSHGVFTPNAETGSITLYTTDEETGEEIYFYEHADFQAALLVALAFLVSTVANACVPDHPQIATGISLLPFVLTFYEMAVGNMNFVVAAVVLLMALIHVVSNALDWYDTHAFKKQERAEKEAEEAKVEAEEVKEEAVEQA